MGIPKEVLDKARKYHEAGDLEKAYETLAEAGDDYAKAAAKIVGEGPNIFKDTVEKLWENYKEGSVEDKFRDVATQHQQQYLDLIQNGKNSEGTFELPDTFEIEKSYLKAVEAHGLPDFLAVDLLINTVNEGVNAALDSVSKFPLVKAQLKIFLTVELAKLGMDLAEWERVLGLDRSRVSEEQLSTSLSTFEALKKLLLAGCKSITVCEKTLEKFEKLWDKLFPEEKGGGGGQDDDPPEDPPRHPEDLPRPCPLDPPPVDPLAIDLDGDGIELISLEDSNTYFDLNVDGFAEKTGWLGSDDGFLVLDKNKNGNIDDASELFGDQTGFENGFEQLAQYDLNKDGVINAKDKIFNKLKVWRDINSNGKVEKGELASLSKLGIRSFDLEWKDTNEMISGHAVAQKSKVKFSDGSTKSSYDILFERDARDTKYKAPDDFEFGKNVHALPELYGYGSIANLTVAHTLSPSLKETTKDLLSYLRDGKVQSFWDEFEDYIYLWAGVGDINPSGRDKYVDARKLAFLEKAYDARYSDALGESSNPSKQDGEDIEAIFDNLVSRYAGRFMAQAAQSELFPTKGSRDVNFENYFDHPLFELTSLISKYDEDTRWLSGTPDMLTDWAVSSLKSKTMNRKDIALGVEILISDLSGVSGYTDMVFLDSFSKHPDRKAKVLFGLVADKFNVSVKSGTDRTETIIVEDASIISGNGGNDKIVGSDYDDFIRGGRGNDFLKGGAGADTYVYDRSDGNDRISDYEYRDALLEPDRMGFNHLVLNSFKKEDVEFVNDQNHRLIIKLPNKKKITVFGQFEEFDTSLETIKFEDGFLYFHDIRAKMLTDMKAAGVVRATFDSDVFLHTKRDGSYDIQSADQYDQLRFEKIKSDKVKFELEEGSNLIIRLFNGETVTLKGNFSTKYSGIGQIHFSDVELNPTEIKIKIFDDMKPNGKVTGTIWSDEYVHNLGDGSYTLNDTIPTRRADTSTDVLTFSKINSAYAKFETNDQKDLIITLLNKEKITIIDQFEKGFRGVEVIKFDDVTLNRDDIVAKVNPDEKPEGDRTGTKSKDVYTHRLGYGSYKITDQSSNESAVDELIFANFNSDSVVFKQTTDFKSLLAEIVDDKGETVEAVTVFRQFWSDSWGVEKVVFDDKTLDDAGIRAKMVSDMKSTGVVRGTNKADVYEHSLGDGTYTIYDGERDRLVEDKFVFVDQNVSDVDFIRNGSSSNLLIQFSNKDVVTIKNQFEGTGLAGIESFQFKDGTKIHRSKIENYIEDGGDDGGDGGGGGGDGGKGSKHVNHYVHKPGDGSYEIIDFYGGKEIVIDTLTLVDRDRHEVTFFNVDKNLEVRLPDEEVITIIDQFSKNDNYGIEKIIFDNETLDDAGIRAKMVEDMKPSGIVRGTKKADVYKYSIGDGPYTIIDSENEQPVEDHFIFLDANPSDVTFSETPQGKNLLIRVSNGDEEDEILINDQFQEGGLIGIELFIFQDGTRISRFDIDV